jgi:4-amino-4-deoxy-L-arabinose transferase-like glycosyltransferase
MQGLAGLFENTRPDEQSRAVHLWFLLSISIVGAWVRLWDLGAVGLHGDEETMAMAVRHILIDGQPILPSGMFYPRGMTQLYLMALSTWMFGESEWSLRLPSVICGVALIGLSYLMGRRFLRPQWNLALAATVALLPELIIYSQTARMYIFLVTCVTASMVCIFEWERTDRLRWLVAAVVVLIIGIDMQLLAVAAILMFMLPGLLQGDLRKLIHSALAAAVVVAGYVFIEYWTQAQYPVPPPEFAAGLGPPPWERSWAPPAFALTFDIALCVSGLTIAFFSLQLVRTIQVRWSAVVSVALLLLGVALQLALFYHLAGLAYLIGLALAYRYGTPQTGFRILVFVFAVGVVALIHASLLASAPGSIIKLVGAMVGQPSVWPYVRVAQLSEAAGVIIGALLAWGIYRFARHRSIPDFWLLAMLGIFVPVFAMGFFAWNVPPRYTSMSLPPLLLCAFAAAQRAFDWFCASRRDGVLKPAWTQAAVAAVIAVLAINPPAFARVLHAGYDLHPDHKGAAEFLRALPLTDEDIVLAEDVLQQTYYLGGVDYWIIGPQVARKFIKRDGNRVVDFYTGTPVIATGAMLDALLQQTEGKRVFVIGSGEDQRAGRLFARGEDLHETIRSPRFKVIYTGRDGLTQILQAVPHQVPRSPSTQAESEADEAALVEDAAAAMESSKAPSASTE